MAQPYVGEIRMFGGNFAPVGWRFCDGQLLAIAENETLFQLIGTTYGGDGRSTFALPDLRGRVPIHQGTGSDGITYALAENGGVEQLTLTTNQIPIHTHALIASTATGTEATPIGNLLAASNTVSMYKAVAPTTPLAAQMLGPDGGNQPHGNFQPYLGINFIISLFGIFPSQT